MIDLIRIRVKAGDGGKGCVAWRHEKFYANGGWSHQEDAWCRWR